MAADKATIKKNVDDMVAAINNGKAATSYAADAYTPYAFVMEPSGKLIVHPYLAGEYLQEKAAPVYTALQQATHGGDLGELFLERGRERNLCAQDQKQPDRRQRQLKARPRTYPEKRSTREAPRWDG